VPVVIEEHHDDVTLAPPVVDVPAAPPVVDVPAAPPVVDAPAAPPVVDAPAVLPSEPTTAQSIETVIGETPTALSTTR
jgi:ribonuclease E